MKRILLPLACIGILASLAGCDGTRKNADGEMILDIDQSSSFSKVVIEGHTFIFYNNLNQAALAHSPNCWCRQRKTIDGDDFWIIGGKRLKHHYRAECIDGELNVRHSINCPCLNHCEYCETDADECVLCVHPTLGGHSTLPYNPENNPEK